MVKLICPICQTTKFETAGGDQDQITQDTVTQHLQSAHNVTITNPQLPALRKRQNKTWRRLYKKVVAKRNTTSRLYQQDWEAFGADAASVGIPTKKSTQKFLDHERDVMDVEDDSEGECDERDWRSDARGLDAKAANERFEQGGVEMGYAPSERWLMKPVDVEASTRLRVKSLLQKAGFARESDVQTVAEEGLVENDSIARSTSPS